MRPSAFTDGYPYHSGGPRCRARRFGCFNEAVGFHRRILRGSGGCASASSQQASMRPSAFTDGYRLRGTSRRHEIRPVYEPLQ